MEFTTPGDSRFIACSGFTRIRLHDISFCSLPILASEFSGSLSVYRRRQAGFLILISYHLSLIREQIRTSYACGFPYYHSLCSRFLFIAFSLPCTEPCTVRSLFLSISKYSLISYLYLFIFNPWLQCLPSGDCSSIHHKSTMILHIFQSTKFTNLHFNAA